MSRRAPIALALGVTAGVLLASAPDAIDKTRTPKCKQGQLLVKVNKKRVCRRTTSLFPTPKAGDTRLAFVKYALAAKVHGKHGKRGRRVRSFASFGKAAGKARAQILRLLPKVLGQADAGRVARSAAVPRAGDCLAAEKPSTYTSKDGNSTMTATADADGITIGFDGTTSGGITIHFTYLTDEGCHAIKIPPCPQASGEVDAETSKTDDVLIEITQGGTVLSYTRVKGKRTTKAMGQNAADAKLDYVKVDDELSSSVTVQGKGIPRTTFNGSFRRTAQWDTRADRWQQDKFQVKITGDIQVDESVSAYSSLVHGIVTSFRKGEQEGTATRAGWSKAESRCITLDFSPASDSLHLKKGNTGSAKGTLTASTGGTAADGKSKVTGQSNGSFTPAQVDGATPSFNYSVTGETGTLSFTVEATSTAGAGSGEWHQPIEKSDSPNRISGPFNGQDSSSGGEVDTWSGTATWKRAPNLDEGNTSRRYYLESASYTVVVSGSDSECSYTGSKQFSYSAQPTQPSFTILNPASDVVFGSPDKDWVLPFTYFWAIYPPPGEGHFPVHVTCTEGLPYDTTGFISDLGFGHQGMTNDGVTFGGSGGETTWNFTGSD